MTSEEEVALAITARLATIGWVINKELAVGNLPDIGRYRSQYYLFEELRSAQLS